MENNKTTDNLPSRGSTQAIVNPPITPKQPVSTPQANTGLPAIKLSTENSQSNPELLDKPPPPKKTKPRPKQKIFGGIDRDTAEYFMDGLSMLLPAGVSIGEALESITAEITRKSVKKALLKVRTEVDDGVPFSEAIAQTGLFNPSVVTLIEVGESTGRLPQNLKVVAVQMHKNNEMSARIRSAMLYPSVLVSLLFVVGTGIGVFLLPKLMTVIQSLHEKVGPITDGLMIFGRFFGHYGLLLAGLIVLLVAALYVAVKLNQKVRAASEVIIFHLPGIKTLLFQTEVARFGFILGSMLEAGLPVITALQSLVSSMSTARYKMFSSKLYDEVDEGSSFTRILQRPENRKLLSGTVCQIIISAEKSGNLDKSLLKIGDNYQEKADITAKNLETLLEPVVLIVIAVAVLFVALAVFLPIYSLIGQFNTQPSG